MQQQQMQQQQQADHQQSRSVFVKGGGGGGRGPANRSNVAAPQWVETGSSVEHMYHTMRADARDHARLRNQFYMQATQAFQAGNAALAKDLSAKGRHHADQMKDSHSQASGAIFAQRNNSGAAGGSQMGQPLTVDLHGLHVNEALNILRHRVPEWRATQGQVLVHLIVGTGHHTRGSRTPARLPAAVEEFLRQESVPYSEPQPGLLEVCV